MSNSRLEAKRSKALKPTPQQKAAFAKLTQRGGAGTLSKEDMLALSTWSALTLSQRAAWAAKAAA